MRKNKICAKCKNSLDISAFIDGGNVCHGCKAFMVAEPKRCCAFSGEKCCSACKDKYPERCEHTAACNVCPCHQAKPEEKKSVYQVMKNQPKGSPVQEKEMYSAVCGCGEKLSSDGSDVECPKCFGLVEWSHFKKVAPKKEKECSCPCGHKDNCEKCKNGLHLSTPSSPESWEEFIDEIIAQEKKGMAIDFELKELKSFIAAKKKEWEAEARKQD